MPTNPSATRMRIEDMLPIAEKLDKAIFGQLNLGWCYIRCLYSLFREDPWERIRKLKQLCFHETANAAAWSKSIGLPPLC